MLAAKSKFSKTMYGPSRPLVTVGTRGSQVASVPGNPSPQHSCGGQTSLLMWLALSRSGNALRRNFYFHFGNKRASQRFRFCEMKSAVGVLFLEASGAAHLHSISGKGCGGRLHPGPRQNPGGVAVWLGSAPRPLETAPTAHRALRWPHPTGQAGLGWRGQTLGLWCPALSPSTLRLYCSQAA